ncbi:MAG: hypothetical protein KBA51_05605 [Kiritimatiellae bacterium]|nr:hypothetical protein [Kiritimatiellia bacterium]
MKSRGNPAGGLLCAVIGIIMLTAGLLKFADPAGFADALSRRSWMPEQVIPFMAVVLPGVETVSAMALMFLRRWRPGAAVLLAGLFLGFALELGLDLARGGRLPCGCFGSASQPAGWGHVAWNLSLVAGCVWILRKSPRSPREVGP